jgi:DNA-binding GntR family transcriptional regulator
LTRVSTMNGPIGPTVVPTVERSQLRHTVAATIRVLIVAGRARPGELLRLAPLAAQMETSITPVREALLLLAQDGWVVQEPNRGFRIAPIGRADVEDTYFVQAAGAGELAARAARVATPEQVEVPRAIDARIARLDDDDEVLAEQLNYELHRELYDIAASPRLVWFVAAASRFVPRRYWATIPGWSDFNRAAHGPIIDLVAAGDAEGARVAMRSHIWQARKLLLEWLDSIRFWETK